MPDDPLQTTQLLLWVDGLRAGDAAARDALFRHVGGRLERLARKMLQGYPGVRRWEQTGDVVQNAVLRLLRALGAVRPDSTRAFFGLAAEQIRRELLDLARHHYGPHGPAAHHASQEEARDAAGDTHEPGGLAEWCEFHRQIDALPEEEREVMHLLFYQGLAQADAAAVLGVTVRTVQRRWQAALLKLRSVFKGEWPGA